MPEGATYSGTADARATRLHYLRMVGSIAVVSVVLFVPSMVVADVPPDRRLAFLAGVVIAAAVIAASLLGVRRDSPAALVAAAIDALAIAGLGVLLGGYYHQIALLFALVVVGHASIHGLRAGLVMVLCGTILVPFTITSARGVNPTDPLFAFVYLLGMAGVIASRDRLRARDMSAIHASETKYRELVERVPAVVYTAELGIDGAWRYVSPRAESWLGFPATDWTDQPGFWLSRVHPDDRQLVIADEEQTAAGPPGRPSRLEYRMIDREGQVRWVRDEATVIAPDDGSRPHWSGFLVDITDRKVLEEQLEHQAFHDPLTGLANRALFTNRVEHALARTVRSEESLAVLFLDLDDFKTVNDGLGHDAGDELLVAVGRALQECLRPMDTVARLGGDEFAILLEDLPDRGMAAGVANRVLAALSRPFVVHGRGVEIGASIGIAGPTGNNLTARDILRNADSAMYAAKRLGKGRHETYAPSMQAAAEQHLELTGEIRRALERGQFAVHYQPTVRLDDGLISGFEALVRWHHPRLGLVPPGAFIRTAEETGQIVAIGRFVIDEACRQARAWQVERPTAPLTMSVNVSARQFRDASLVASVADALAATSLDPSTLILEITESVVMEDSDEALNRLLELKALGVHLAIDDFGIGYSSLSYLRRLPVDVLKIDKSFVDGIVGGGQGFELARVIVRMARTLNLQTIAEGVEEPAQAAALRQMGCEQAQGYHFARPMVPEEALELLRNGRLVEAQNRAS
jgi:diguanylate cyclase (GGDEF)-like protein/PAS domain S-box-containing protein